MRDKSIGVDVISHSYDTATTSHGWWW